MVADGTGLKLVANPSRNPYRVVSSVALAIKYTYVWWYTSLLEQPSLENISPPFVSSTPRYISPLL